MVISINQKSKSVTEADGRHGQIQALFCFLADTYALYLKTQNFHRNMRDPMFRSLHLLFEEQYRELAKAVDTIAERIRALGKRAPASFSQFMSLTSMKEVKVGINLNEMICSLIESHEGVIHSALMVVEAANETCDYATIDLATERIRVHEKALWMLRSQLHQ